MTGAPAWTGALTCLAILLAAAAGFTWGSTEIAGAWWCYASLEPGGVFVSWWGPVGGFAHDIELDQREQMRDMSRLFGFSRPAAAIGDGLRWGIAWIPFWAPLILFGIPTAWLWRLDRPTR